MRTRWILLLGLVLALGCYGFLAAVGDTYVYKVPLTDPTDAAEAYEAVLDSDAVQLQSQTVSDGQLCLKLHSAHPGKAFVDVTRAGAFIHGEQFFVHRNGVITQADFFGASTGSIVIPIAAMVFACVLLVHLLRRYRAAVRQNMYQYCNVLLLGLVVFFGFALVTLLLGFQRQYTLIEAVRRVLGASSNFSTLTLPVAFVLSILITISNLRLMRREGRTWRNMLGCMLGVLLCVSTIVPIALGEFLQRTTLVDVHNERGAAMYVELVVEHTIFAVVAYLECILIATVIFGFKTARHVPAYDKDYMLILGCQIRRDGTLTKLLQSRVDRAVAFAAAQEAEGGKALIFVPSGGQGSDEIISEGEAMRRYLVGIGVPESRILPETESVNTDENIRNSVALIRSQPDGETANIVFSTTNYHVFRAGLIASRQGVPMEGVGAPTKRYFWVNAFVREFIATLYTERRTHTLVIAVMLLLTYAMIGMVYLSNTL